MIWIYPKQTKRHELHANFINWTIKEDEISLFILSMNKELFQDIAVK
jgi:hypothetical protein